MGALTTGRHTEHTEPSVSKKAVEPEDPMNLVGDSFEYQPGDEALDEMACW